MSLFGTDFINAKTTIQNYAQVLSDIKGSLSVHQKNWEEFSLKIYAKGLTTTPIPIKRKNYFDALDLNLNLVEHKLKIFCAGKRLSINLRGQSQIEFAEELKSIFDNLKIYYTIPENKFAASAIVKYSQENVEEIWGILREVYFAMLQFKSNKLEETSNINFWAHHFDIAMLMFNGKIIPKQDPQNWDYSREQMNYGFSFGDDAITHPYFYITHYPVKDKLFELKLPVEAYWHKDGWKGAVSEIRQYNYLSLFSERTTMFFNWVYALNNK